MKIKNTLLQIMLLVLATGCGGGGGAGGGSNIIIPPTTPNIPVIKPVPEEPKVPEVKPVPEELEKNKSYIKNTVKLPEVSKYETPIIEEKKEKENRFVMGISDSDFVTNKKKLIENYKSKGIELEIYDKNDVNYSDHGEYVLGEMVKGITPKVIAISQNTKDKGIVFDFNQYKEMLEAMKRNDAPGENKLKVVNQSWGSDLTQAEEREIFEGSFGYRKSVILRANSYLTIGLIEDIEKAGMEVIEFYNTAINKNNALFIWANGNLSADIPGEQLSHGGLQSAVPLIKSSVEKGWISVIGLDGDRDYTPLHLAHAGVVKNWAISADGNLADGSGSGSSFAAPKVANVALQVANKFDWMTNNDVRLTLFTTTNNIETGNRNDEDSRYRNSFADNKYGWGVLNKDRALKGPGAFWREILKADSSTLDISKGITYYFNANIPTGKTSYFENIIYGDAGLKKRGGGTLILTEDNLYTKDSKLEEGTLEIYKKHLGGMDILQNGKLVLHNDARVGYRDDDSTLSEEEKLKNVKNGGEIQLTGTTAYVGNYIDNSGTLTLKENSYLSVLGTANVTDTKINVVSDEYVTANGRENVVLKANSLYTSGVTGNSQGMKKVELTNNNNELVANITRENAVNYLGNSSESSLNTAKILEDALQDFDKKMEEGILSATEKSMGKSIISMSVPQLNTATEVMSGEIYASAQALTFNHSQDINRSLSHHLAGLDNFSSSDFDLQGWFSFQNTSSKLKQDGYATAKTKINGGQYGIDKKFNGYQLGVALNNSTSKGDFEKYAGKYESDAIGISLYGKKYLPDNYYLLGRGGVTRFENEVNRTLLTSTGDFAEGKINYNDTMLSSYIEFGKQFNNITPYIGYSCDLLKRGAFNENNASWGISADKKNYLKQNILLGIQGEYKTDNFTLTSHITEQLNIGSRDLSFDGRFTDGEKKYNFKGIKQKKNTTWLGFGINKDIASKFGVSFNVDFKLEEFKKDDTSFRTELYYRF